MHTISNLADYRRPLPSAQELSSRHIRAIMAHADALLAADQGFGDATHIRATKRELDDASRAYFADVLGEDI